MKDFVIADNNTYVHKGFGELKGQLENGSKTLLEALIENSKQNPNRMVLGKIVNKSIEYKSYADIEKMSKSLASFLETKMPERSILGIYSSNRIEWLVGEYASYFANCVNCPLLLAFSAESLNHIFQETEMKILVVSVDNMQPLLDKVLNHNKHSIETIVLMDADLNAREVFEKLGFDVYYLCDIYKKYKKSPSRTHPLPQQMATICYTSGTTGLPKGAMLTHANFISQIEGYQIGARKYGIVNLNNDDVYISFLPLAHVLERTVLDIAFVQGVTIVFSRGDMRQIKEDFKIISPTFLTSVPRVWTAFHSKIEEAIMKLSFFKRSIFRIGMAWKKLLLKFGSRRSWIFDALVFDKISNEFGGRIRASLCGGAAINPKTLDYLQCVLSAEIFMGYGQTEGLAANIVPPMSLNDASSVGIPFPSTKIKIVPDSELEQPYGHIFMKGPCVSSGYYKRDDLTRNSFDKDGWLITGDVGKFENGRFYINGRSKDFFKTSFGEYIFPEKLENEFMGQEIEDCFITTSIDSDYLLALVVCQNQNLDVPDIAKIIKDKGAKLVSDNVICRYEIPIHFVVIRNPFNYYDGGNLITPSMKKKRELLMKFFKKEIENGFKTKY